MIQRKKSQSIGLLMIGVFLAVLLWALAAMVQPSPVAYADDPPPPQIETITVTSSEGTYFYSPGLGEEGGTVYFNSVGGEGAGQVLAVTVTCSGTVTSFEGAPAFGSNPPPDTIAPWQVNYTVEAGAGTQSGIVFTATNAGGVDTAVITFIQDNTGPTVTSPYISEGSDYLYRADDLVTVYYGDDMGWAQHFTVNGSSSDTGAGLDRAQFSAAFGNPAPFDDETPSSWYASYYPDNQDWGNNTITVTVSDRVGNSTIQTFDYIRDTTNPTIYYGSPPIAESSSYLHAEGTTVYYSDQMGGTAKSFTVQGSATDSGAGPWQATFYSPDLNDPGPDITLPDWSGTYYVDSSDSGDDLITVRVYDNVSNQSQRTFSYVEDTTPPTVELTDVTDPYDFDSNELDDDGSNWYNDGRFIGGNWQFTSDTADDGAGRASCAAFWDHSNDAYDHTTSCPLDGDGSFNGVNNDLDGTVTVTVTVTDNVGNSADDTVGFHIDNTEPTITSPHISESSDYLYADGLTVYYGDDMGWVQTFTVSGSSSDTGIGLNRAEFSGAFGATPDDVTTPNTWSGRYYPDEQNWGDGTITVTIYDLLGNAAYQTFNYIRDAEPPTVDDVTCPAITSELSFPVSWGASDLPSGLDHYDVQYKRDSDSQWRDWHTNTLLTQDTFGPTSPTEVEDDHTYCFRMYAADKAGNGQYTDGGDCTEIDISYGPEIKKVFLPLVMVPDPNWGFETGGFTGWQHGGQLTQSVSTARHYSGSYSALLGSPSYACHSVPVGSAWLRRSVTVPFSDSPTLSFCYRIYTQDKNSILSDQYDLFAVYINGSRVFADANRTLDFGCDKLYDLEWQCKSLSLDAYNKGQTIEITFHNYNRAPSGNYPTYFNTYTYVDDVSVQ